MIEYDDTKDASNSAEHGLSFADFMGFDEPPLVLIDDRQNYGEHRYRAFCLINGRGHCLVFTMRGEAMRSISFRRARAKELQRHGR